MSPHLSRFLSEVKSRSSSFEEVDLSDLNTTNYEGENILHLAVRWGDLDATQELLRAGVNPNQHGDLGHTPLHEACIKGNLDVVKVLVGGGADLFALTEGHPPFTSARFAGHDEICDYLSVEMKAAMEKEQQPYIRARIEQLRREIGRLERILSESDT
jgi:ankyrin repeat protein